MADLVTDAVRKLQLDDWWQSVHSSLNDMTTQDVADYASDSQALDATASDGIR